MLEILIFTIILILGLFLVFRPKYIIFPNQDQAGSKFDRIPGADCINKIDGNLADIAKAGSLHQYLTSLHERYGSIASFWWGPQYVVSLCSGELFKQCNHLFDRPVYLYKMFEPLLTKHCIQFANSDDGHYRRSVYDPSFSHGMMQTYYNSLTTITKKLANHWDVISTDQPIHLSDEMAILALRSIVQVSFGGFFLQNEKELQEFKKHYDICWEDLENTLKGDHQVDGNERFDVFEKSRQKMYKIMKNALDYRRAHPPSSPQEEVLLDAMISSNLDEEVIFADSLEYIIGGFHTTGNLMTWCLYHLARDDKIQQRVYEELIQVIGKEDDISPSDIPNLKYCRQVIDETLRWSTLAPFAARYSTIDMKLGGHIIPRETPILFALGVASTNENVWSHPDKFDPDRFNDPSNLRHHPFAFKPFGFAGKRMCPGYRLAYTEAHIFLSVLVRKFDIHLIDAGKDIRKCYGLVTHPEKEIYIGLQKR